MALGPIIATVVLTVVPPMPPQSPVFIEAQVGVRDRLRCHNHINCTHACRNLLRFGPRYRFCIRQCEGQNRLRPCNLRLRR